ncbi:TIGR02281 family clan AA aspartic protease [Labrys sp. ZIDIC5]|uniref:TIGR02281 family clan AA aspartic protease n=1 Tax=Labrys sedimenti TaxID=3106036 RepID=UPI002ACA7762|nr:TIGR02281 family clan AA aspartic protease [Labrys sp. ZIDIC5]MDZ5452825.1 TIGR02281 family clan AA aspartic protease [Labrys sp. ZIDIC5]
MQLDQNDRIGGPLRKQWALGPIVGLITSILLVCGGLYFYRDIEGLLNYGKQTAANSFNGDRNTDFGPVYRHLAIAPLEANIAYQSDVQVALKRLRAEDCDRNGIFQLSRALEQAGKIRIAAQALEGFAAACRNTDGELYRAADLYFALGDYDKAAALGDQLIKASPYNGQIQYLRGQASNAKEQWAEALPFYINAIELLGSPKDINATVFTQLANIYDHLGRTCDAITAIQTWVLADPASRDGPQTRKMVNDFSKKGKCDSDTARGVEHVPKSSDGVMLVKAQVNDIGGTFIVDTGATFVSLTRDFAKRAKVDISGANAVSLQTANGQITADLGIASSVKLGHAQAKKVALVVQEPSLGKGVDGLLGMSFLARFNVTVTDKELQLKAMNAP